MVLDMDSIKSRLPPLYLLFARNFLNQENNVCVHRHHSAQRQTGSIPQNKIDAIQEELRDAESKVQANRVRPPTLFCANRCIRTRVRSRVFAGPACYGDVQTVLR